MHCTFIGLFFGHGVCGTDEPEEEADIPKTRRVPVGPTKEEKEKDEAARLPNREWCKHCVRGCGRAGPRVEEEDEEGDITRLVMDYCCMGKDRGETMDGGQWIDMRGFSPGLVHPERRWDALRCP